MSYRIRRPSYLKELYYILCIAAVALILISSFLGPGGYLALRKARAENAKKAERIDEILHRNQERRKTIEALRSDEKELEKEARKKGYARKDEIIQQLPPEPEK
jgi:cell division protein FtsB